MNCANGHPISTTKAQPRFCPTCGVAMVTQCANGHDVPVGDATCAICATAVGASQIVGSAKAGALPPLTSPPPPLSIGSDQQRSRNPATIPVLLGAGALLIIGLIIGVILAAGHSTPTPASSAPPVAQGSSPNGTQFPTSGSGDTGTTGSGSSEGNTGTSGNTGNTGSSGSAESEATQLNSLIASSAQARTGVQPAYNDIDSCGGNYENDAAVLQQAASTRQGLLTNLSQLDLSQLPQSQVLVQDLQAVWNDSVTADQDYAQWAQDEENGCTNQDHGDQNWVGGNTASVQANNDKDTFTQQWNSTIASTYDLPQWQPGQI